MTTDDKYILSDYTGEEVEAALDQVRDNQSDIENLDIALQTERSARIKDDAALGSRITSEETARKKGDEALQDGIDAEKEAREKADEAEKTAREKADTALDKRVDGTLSSLDSSYEEESVTIYGYSDKDNNKPIASADIDAATQEKAGVMSAEDKRHLDAALYTVDATDYFPDYVETQIRGYDGDGHSVTINAATRTKAGVMSAADKTMLDALALYREKSVVTVGGMDFQQGDVLEILKGHRPTRYAVTYETETTNYVCGILDVYTSRDGRVLTEIYTGGCDLMADFTGGRHDSGRVYQFMRQYRIFGSGTPEAGTWSAWRTCLSEGVREELYAMGLSYKEWDDYIEISLDGREGGVVGGSVEIPNATAEHSGFMSKEDKVLLDSFDGKIKNEENARKEKDAEIDEEMKVRRNADAELLKRIQGKSEYSNPYTDPFKYVLFSGDGYIDRFHEWLDGLHTTEPEADPQKAGHFRVSLEGVLYEVINTVLNWTNMRFLQVVSGGVTIDNNGKLSFTQEYSILQRLYDGGKWSAWQDISVSAPVEGIADGLQTDYASDSVGISLYDGDKELFGNNIAAATQDKAGVMSAEDKKKLDGMGADGGETVVFTGAAVDEETETLILNAVDEEAETLMLNAVGGSVPGSITKVSQLENDKGYLTGEIDDERIILKNN